MSTERSALLPESGPVGPRKAPTNINERVCVCVSVCLCAHWLCASDDQTGGVIMVMAWRFGRLTGRTMQSLGMHNSVADCQEWPCEAMARWCHGMVTCCQMARYDSWKPSSTPVSKSVLGGSFRKAQREPHAKPLVWSCFHHFQEQLAKMKASKYTHFKILGKKVFNLGDCDVQTPQSVFGLLLMKNWFRFNQGWGQTLMGLACVHMHWPCHQSTHHFATHSSHFVDRLTVC